MIVMMILRMTQVTKYIIHILNFSVDINPDCFNSYF